MRYQRRTLKKILDWANGIDSTTEYSEMYHTILVHLDDERCGRLQHIAKLEQEMASFLVRTAYVVLLSIPGVSIVTAAEFAGEMGPITNYANDQAITVAPGSIPPATRATRSTAATAPWCAAPTASCAA